VVNCVCTKETGTAGWELEGFNSEWEVLIIRIEDKESVVDVLLQTFALIALWYKRTGITGSQTLFNTGGLSQSFVMSFDIVNNDSPFAFGVDSTKRSDVGSLRWAKVSFFFQSIGSLNREFSVEVSYISIEAPDLFEMSINGSLYFICWVLCIFKTPSFGVVD